MPLLTSSEHWSGVWPSVRCFVCHGRRDEYLTASLHFFHSLFALRIVNSSDAPSSLCFASTTIVLLHCSTSTSPLSRQIHLSLHTALHPKSEVSPGLRLMWFCRSAESIVDYRGLTTDWHIGSTHSNGYCSCSCWPASSGTTACLSYTFSIQREWMSLFNRSTSVSDIDEAWIERVMSVCFQNAVHSRRQ